MNEENFNKNHPELREGEVWLTNDEANDVAYKEWIKDWKTARVGAWAYDIYGEKVEGLRPIFVSKEEVEDNRRKHLEGYVVDANILAYL